MTNSKQCFFKQNGINYIDYKDTEILKRFINPHGRIMAKKKTGVCSKNQRKLANAIKLARFMALLPYVSR